MTDPLTPQAAPDWRRALAVLTAVREQRHLGSGDLMETGIDLLLDGPDLPQVNAGRAAVVLACWLSDVLLDEEMWEKVKVSIVEQIEEAEE